MSDSKNRTVGYGTGVHRIVPKAVPDDAVLTGDELVEHLLSVFRSTNYEPPLLPAAAIELLELSRKPDVSFADVVRLVEKDPLIAGKVLRVAQSAVYARSGVISTLDQAVVRLGVTTLSQIFFEAAMKMRVFRASGYEAPMERLSRHSAATAHVARIVARRTALYDEYAFVCGLLHDVGIAACMIALADTRRSGKLPEFAQEWPAIRQVHEVASGILAACWNLPADIKIAVSHHHTALIGGHAHPIASVVLVADWVVSQLDLGFESEAAPQSPHHAIAALQIGGDTMTKIVAEAHDVAVRLMQSAD